MWISGVPKLILKTTYVLVVLLLCYAGIVVVTALFSRYFEYTSLGNGNRQLRILATGGIEDYGLFDIKNNDTEVSLILEPAEWNTLIELWERATSSRPRISRFIGEIAETGTFDNARLAVFAGQDVRFVLHENGACADYSLAPNDVKGFERSIRLVQKRLQGKTDGGGVEITDPSVNSKIRQAFGFLVTGPRSHPIVSSRNCSL